MSEEFGPNFITLTDEDGNDIELEYVDALEDNGQTYMAFFPTVDDETDEAAAEDFGLVILKSVTENGEELLTTLDSDEELQRVYDLFMEQLMDEDDDGAFETSYEVTCPNCGTVNIVDEDTLMDSDKIVCAECGAAFDVEVLPDDAEMPADAEAESTDVTIE